MNIVITTAMSTANRTANRAEVSTAITTPDCPTLQSYRAGRWQRHTAAQTLTSAINGCVVAATHAD